MTGSPSSGDVPPPASRAASTSHRLLQAGAIAFLVFLAYLLFRPILSALMWGGLLAVISAHGYEQLVGRLGGRRGLGILVVGLAYVLILVLPLIFFILEAVAHAPLLASLPERLSSGEVLEKIEKAEQATSVETGLPDWLRTFRDHFDDRMAQLLPHLGSFATWLVGRIGVLGAFLFEFLLGCAIALALLYHRFAVRAFVAKLLFVIGGDFTQSLMQQTFDATRAAFRGVVAAATAQTVLTAIALVVAGVPGVVMLSALTFVLALVQIGPLVTAIIASGILLMQGAVLAAGLSLVWFLLVVMSVDNLIRPYFASRANDTPAFLTFLGALGGILAFGLIGVFIGPVLIALLHRLLITWVDKEALAAAA